MSAPGVSGVGGHAHRFVDIAVVVPLRQSFTYRVPDALAGALRLGQVVRVPFGRRGAIGYVLGTRADADIALAKLKPVQRLVEAEPVFDETQLAFFRWIADYYLAPLGEVIATALPSAYKGGPRTVHHASPEGIEALAVDNVVDQEAEVLREVIARPGLTRRGLLRRLRELVEPDEARKALDRLRRRGLVVTDEVERGVSRDTVRVMELIVPPDQLATLAPRAGSRQKAVVVALAEAGGAMDLPELLAALGPGARDACRRLLAAGVLEESTRELRDAVTVGELPDTREAPVLTAAQEEAVQAILGEPQAWLLHGVTGAGKTEVYLRAAASVLERGEQVLILVPEIGLTPLLTGRFRARFGELVAVLHSGLTGSQRLREWRRIRAGDARVAVGARSALFAPFRQLGLVVVDEEHDDSYKQDDGVRYSARDMAVVRGRMAGCPVVLGSATPGLETWFNARHGRYGLLQLLERPTAGVVPEMEIVDLNTEPRVDGAVPLLSEAVRQALRQAFDAGGKAIVLYNRRGYATFVQCVDCGGSYSCPSCGVALVLHQGQRTLTCHYCGFHRPYQQSCPSCDGDLEVLGRGTERVEEALSEAFPDVPVGRMDADTTSTRGAHHRLLEDFRAGRFRLLVGTQIVAKGHDFPDVHVAVVLGADHVLRMPDFRAAERAYSLLTQLGGRAGRGDVPGRVLVQTHHPEHYALRLLHDFDAFFDEESRHRRLLGYPPFARLALVRVEAAQRSTALAAAAAIARRLRSTADGRTVQVLGPAAAALPRLVGRWRFQLLLRGRQDRAFRRWLDTADLRAPPGPKVRVVVDIDPRHLM